MRALRDFVVAPTMPGGDAAPVIPLRPVDAPDVARDLVLGPAREGLPAAVALAEARRRRDGARAAALGVWGAAAPSAAATGTARREAERLRARELAVTAAGRLACVALPAADEAAAAAVRRLLAGAQALPVVVLLAAARGEALEALVDRFDAVLLAGVDPLVAEHAVATLPRPARVATLGANGLDRRLARVGAARAARRTAVA